MNSIVQGILNKSKLEIDHIKITNATKKYVLRFCLTCLNADCIISSFLMSLKGKATKIGVATATISAMTVDLVGPSGAFGRLQVPDIKMGSLGADISILNQEIRIIDMNAFTSFVRAVMQDDNLLLRLENGQTTVKSMGMKSSIVYKKEIHLKGLKLLQATLLKAEQDGNDVESIFSLANPSQFEIDLGTVIYEVQNGDGRRIGEQKGSTHVKRGNSSLTLTGAVCGAISKGKTKFVGVGVEEDNWLKEVIKSIYVVINI